MVFFSFFIMCFFSLQVSNASENLEKMFTRLYNEWGMSSGEGSTLVQTEMISKAIPELLIKLECRTMLDLGCGDYVWMRYVDLPVDKYIGADVVQNLLQEHNRMFGDEKHSFLYLNSVEDKLPQVDLILCRDFLVHYSNEQICKVLTQIKASGSKYLLTTTFPERNQQRDRPTGGWRPLNLLQEPFNFPKPLLIINEQCTQFIDGVLWNDKCLVLWEIKDLPF